MGDLTNGLAVRGKLADARPVIERALAEAELDGFLAAHFLARYCAEDRHAQLAGKLASLRDGYVFARANVAMLGIALAVGWLPATPTLLAQFVGGCERLERQQPLAALDFRRSLKVLWGLGLGTAAAAVTAVRPDLPGRIAEIVRDYRGRVRDHPRDHVLATEMLIALEPTRRQPLARELAHYLLTLNPDHLSDPDAAAALWAVRLGCIAHPAELEPQDDLQELQTRLIPRLLRLGGPDDVLDALLADHLQSELLRQIASGGVVARDAMSVVLRTIDSFPELARRLHERKHGRPVALVGNEYDVQDLLYVALKPHVPDLTDEEWTAKHAGGAKRIDFVSRAARLCLEAKMPRDHSHAREIADELKVDIESYYVHEACDRLVVFVYDPALHMADPALQEAELSGLRTIKGRTVDVLVRIRPR